MTHTTRTMDEIEVTQEDIDNYRLPDDEKYDDREDLDIELKPGDEDYDLDEDIDESIPEETIQH